MWNLYNPFKIFDDLKSDVKRLEAQKAALEQSNKDLKAALASNEAEILKLGDDIKKLLGSLAAKSAQAEQAKAILDSYTPIKSSRLTSKDLKLELASARESIESAKQALK